MNFIQTNYYLQDSVFILKYDVPSILNNVYDKKDCIGQGTYCCTFRLSNDKVIKFYGIENYLEDSNCFCSEIINEIAFIKKFNNCKFITKTFLILESNKQLIIIQEYAKIMDIKSYDIYSFINKIQYFIDILKINLYLYSKNYINLDIKSDNMGYLDKELKLFDFNLIIEINKSTKIDLLNDYKYYFLHPPVPTFPKNIISYSIAIIILESFSSNYENSKYLYTPTNIYSDKIILLKSKINIMGVTLSKILNDCFEYNKCPYLLLSEFENFIN